MGFFIAFQNAILRIITCSYRYYFNQNSGLTDFCAGLIAGSLTYSFIGEDFKIVFAYFTFSRLFDAIINLLEKNKRIKIYKYSQIYAYSILTVITGYSFAIEPKFMNRTLFNMYQRFCTFDSDLLKF